jgi:thiol-disulfide isomerase/thioredoxin
MLLFTSLVMLQLVAQRDTVTIHGIVKDTSVKRVEITHLIDTKLTKWEHSKLNVVNGVFTTSIQIPFPIEISISYGNRIYGKIFISNDSKLVIDTVGTIHIIGSAMQNEYENQFLPFFQLNDNLFDSIQSFYQRNRQMYGNDFPTIIQDSANLLKETFGHQRSELLGRYIKLHSNSYVALWNIYYFLSMGSFNQYFDFEKLFSSFSNGMQKQSFIKVLKEKLEESDKMQAGQIFPKDFFKGYEQMERKVKENNQYYLIDFWYSHCVPCAKRFPKLKEIYSQFHDKGFDIVSISVDKLKDKKDYVAAIEKNGLLWNHVWDKDGANAEKFNIKTFPTYVLLDKNGKVMNFDIQEGQLEAFLREHL